MNINGDAEESSKESNKNTPDKEYNMLKLRWKKLKMTLNIVFYY